MVEGSFLVPQVQVGGSVERVRGLRLSDLHNGVRISDVFEGTVTGVQRRSDTGR